MEMTTERLAWLLDFYSYKRPHLSKSEQAWIEKYIYPVIGSRGFEDGAGNIHLDLRDSFENRTLFVAHTDSVHREGGRQYPVLLNGKIYAPKGSNCLGADDATGCLILLHMIKNNVPAYYIFTRGEERGGIGARHIADKQPELLEQFDRAVAFDRRDTYSIITHQAYGRTCSDEFADALSDGLATDYLMHCPDQTGVYTDTAEFIDIIPECTNISAGYMREHTINETQDIRYLLAMMDRVVQLDWDALPTVRDPYALDPDAWIGYDWADNKRDPYDLEPWANNTAPWRQ